MSAAVPDRIPAEAFALFDDPNLAHVATRMPDGSPQVTPVWVERGGRDYPSIQPGEVRLIVRVTPEAVTFSAR